MSRTGRRQQRRIARLIGLSCVGAMLVVAVRSNLFSKESLVKQRHDVNFLPPPSQVVTMSLGYRHALADVLWAHLLVAQGLRLKEKRRFDTLINIYDAVNALDPTFRTPYVMADALITFNIIPTTKGTEHVERTLPYPDVLKTRQVLERGVKALPYDAEIWLILGQFVAFIAPSSYLEDRPEEAERWRREGAAYLEKAVELSGGQSEIGWHALGGAAVLREAGELDASVRFYERLYAVTDDDELRKAIQHRLDLLRGQRDKEFSKLDRDHQARVDERLRTNRMYTARSKAALEWARDELPFITPHTSQTIGPPPRPSACAGPGHEDVDCATNWATWAEGFAMHIERGSLSEK